MQKKKGQGRKRRCITTTNLGEDLQVILQDVAMVRTKGEARIGTEGSVLHL